MAQVRRIFPKGGRKAKIQNFRSAKEAYQEETQEAMYHSGIWMAPINVQVLG